MYISHILLIGLIGLYVVSADVSHIANNNNDNRPVTDVCLGCICEASSKCDRTYKCVGDVCGMFKITWAYWADAGKPTQSNESPESQSAYANCVTEPFCAARAVQGYMTKYGQDCNGDGVINCMDHTHIHVNGGFGCAKELPKDYRETVENCLRNVQQYQN